MCQWCANVRAGVARSGFGVGVTMALSPHLEVPMHPYLLVLALVVFAFPAAARSLWVHSGVGRRRCIGTTTYANEVSSGV